MLDLRLRHQPLRVLDEVAKGREWLATKRNLLVVAPQPLRVEIQQKRGKREQVSLGAVVREAYTICRTFDGRQPGPRVGKEPMVQVAHLHSHRSSAGPSETSLVSRICGPRSRSTRSRSSRPIFDPGAQRFCSLRPPRPRARTWSSGTSRVWSSSSWSR